MSIRAGIAWRSLTVIAAVAGLASGGALAAGNSQGKVKASNNAYIVQLADMPVTAYQGGIKGLQATKPKRGQKIDPNSPAVVSYMAYLASRQDALLNGVVLLSALLTYQTLSPSGDHRASWKN